MFDKKDSYFPQKQHWSCDTSGFRNIEISNGTLKLIVKKEKYLGHKLTGATITSKVCFQKGRIEIFAKPVNSLQLTCAAFMYSHRLGCNLGQQNCKVSIVEFRNDQFENEGIIKQQAKTILYYGKNDYQERVIDFKFDRFVLFGIGWNDNYLITFIDGMVFNHVNRFETKWGQNLRAKSEVTFLPFEHPFNLLLHIGDTSASYDLYNDGDFINRLVTEVFEIDYVRFYGEVIEVYRNQSNIEILFPPKDKSYLDFFIISLAVVLILIILIMILIAFFLRKKRQISLQKHTNDNLNQEIIEENKYEEFNYDYAYEFIPLPDDDH